MVRIQGAARQALLANWARLALMVALSGTWLGLLIASARAEVTSGEEVLAAQGEQTAIPLADLPPTATTVDDWVAQIEAALVQIIGVQLEETEAGLQLVLETAGGELATPTTSVSGDALILEIPNAVLVGEAFEQFEPTAGIALVQVSTLPGDRVQVLITGTDAVPEVAVGSDATGLTLSVVAGVAQTGEADDAIQIVVTGEEDEGYNPSSASVGTLTDTPLRDIPQSIQVVPRQVIEDRNVQSISEAVETVSSIIDSAGFFGASGVTSRIVRGFEQGFGDGAGNLRNGLRDGGFYSVRPIGTVEQIEVLKGPASVLYGALEPGGIINITTRQPLSEPFYEFSFEAGNNSRYEPSVDFTGPLTADETLLYRLITGYQVSEGIQDFIENDLFTLAPSITWNISDRTRVNAYYEYVNFSGNPSLDSSPVLSDGSFLPRSLYPGYPEFSSLDIATNRIGYTLNHELSNNWQIRNGFAISLNQFKDNRAFPGIIQNDSILTGFSAFDLDYSYNNYFAQIDVLGEFETGSISHQLLAGFDFNYYRLDYQGFANFTDLPPLDINNPNYTVARPQFLPFLENNETIVSYGVYLQDQIDIGENLRLLVGGRYDWVSYENEIADFGILGNTIDDPVQSDGAFSPRIGLVYQPSDTLSLYASYSQSFRQSTGFNPDGSAFEPTRGTQYEIGIRTDLIENRLSANLAVYRITKTNITTTSAVNSLFSVQTGEARSQGIELDISGEILSGWNIIASYAYTDAEVTQDNTIPVGSRLRNVPENQASLWTTYEIQEGDLSGLGFGIGLFYVGERAGDFTPNSNPFMLDSYLRTDAALFYRKNRFNAAINIRNIFDIDYATSSFSRNSVTRGDTFSIIGSISWEF